MPPYDKELLGFMDAASRIAGGIENVEDFKFCIFGQDVTDDKILTGATMLLTGECHELRDC